MLVLCSGMARSGSTLQYNLARSYLEQTVGVDEHGFFTREDIEGMFSELKTWASRSDWHILKCHDLPSIEHWDRLQMPVFILYVHRDLRDVGPSLQRVFGGTDEEVLHLIEGAIEFHERVTNLSMTKVQRYDDLCINPTRCLRDICQFLRIPIDHQVIYRVAKMHSPDRMRQISSKVSKTKLYVVKRLAWKLKNQLGIGSLLRRYLPASYVRNIRRLIEVHDPETMLHPDHIRSDVPTITQQHSRLCRQIDIHFARWLTANGYGTLIRASADRS